MAVLTLAAVPLAAQRLQLVPERTVVLEKAEGAVTQAVFDEGEKLIWIRDYDSNALDHQGVELYSWDGAAKGTFGRGISMGPGGFFRLMGIGRDPQGNLWCADLDGRVTVLSRDLRVQSSFVAKGNHPYPYYASAIVFDAANEKVHLAGCYPLHEYLSAGCLELHSFAARDFRYLGSVLESPAFSPQEAPFDPNWLLDADARGTLYLARMAVPELLRLTPPHYDAVKTGFGQFTFVAPKRPGPEASIGEIGAAWRAAEKAVALVALENHVAVAVERPASNRHDAVFFDKLGKAEAQLPTPGTLVGKLTGDRIVIASRQARRWTLTVMRVGGPADDERKKGR